jgi:hypothetical protein
MKEIELTQGKVALVDDEDYEYLNQWNWFAQRAKYTFYARRNISDPINRANRTTCPMHRVILEQQYGELDDQIVDHINGNGLDNRRSNLRITDRFGNARNSKKKPSRVNKHHPYKGITFARGRWCAQIKVGNRHIHCGYYSTPEEAAAAYDEAAKRFFGEFARTNDSPLVNIGPLQMKCDGGLPKKRKGTTSIYKGVSYQPERCKWVAYIDVNRKRFVLGRYTTQEDAAIAYNKAALFHFGERAQLNKICGVQGKIPEQTA